MHAHAFGKTPRIVANALALTALLAIVTGQGCSWPPPSNDGAPPVEFEPQPKVRFETTRGSILLELFSHQAPQTVENFLQYVRDGFYDGLIFHEARAGQSVAAGRYTRDLQARETRDPVANESNNGLSNRRGRVALLEPDGPGTGTSAFLLLLADQPNQDFDLETGRRGRTVFGEVIEGMDLIQAISEAETTEEDAPDGQSLGHLPVEPVIILKAFVDTGRFTGPNNPPVANAGPDLSVRLGHRTSLDGSGSSDPDGEEITFVWRQISGPPVTLSRTDVVRPSFTPTTVATLVFELTVTDERGMSAADSVTVTVSSPHNQPPVANAGPDQTVQAGQLVVLDASASGDPDGQTITYAWNQTDGTSVALSSPAVVKPSFTAPAAGGVLVFELTVTDALGGVATDTVAITVNLPPTASAGADRLVFAGITATLRGAGSDPDAGDPLSFAWRQTAGPAVTLSDTAARRPTFTVPTNLDALSFELTVSDGKGGSATDEVTLTPIAEPQVRLRTSMGDIVLHMLETQAPITVKNFLEYVDSGFYDGTIFHRVAKDFVVQGGGFLPGKIQKTEGLRDPIVNEFDPSRPNLRGTVAMAKTSDPDSATSQFFINWKDNPSLDDPANSGGFAVFAEVAEGMDVVDAMNQVEITPEFRPDDGAPVEEILLHTATIEEAPKK